LPAMSNVTRGRLMRCLIDVERVNERGERSNRGWMSAEGDLQVAAVFFDFQCSGVGEGVV
jgi:hypothetical protein